MITQLQKSLIHAIEKTGRGLFLGENLDAMRAYYEIAQHNEARKIDLCYIDPPFNSKRNYNVIYHDSVADKRVAQQGFSDVWSKYNFDQERNELEVLNHYTSGPTPKHKQIESYLDCIKDIATESHVSYLHFMAVRVWYIWLLLKNTGSLYLHCDPTMSHYLKQLCDIIFGTQNFRNEIVWSYQTGGVSKRWFGKKHDVIFFYSKTEDYFLDLEKVKEERTAEVLRRIRTGTKNATRAENEERLPFDVWDIQALNAMANERKGYPTQKPEALLERIILASSQEGELVVDFFAGCGTAPRVAERFGRRWLAFDKQVAGVRIIEQDAQNNKLTLIRKQFSETTYENQYLISEGLPADAAQLRAYLKKSHRTYDIQRIAIEYCLGGVCNEKQGSDGGQDGWVNFNVGGNSKDIRRYIIEVDSSQSGITLDKVRARVGMLRKEEHNKKGLVIISESFTTGMRKEAEALGMFNKEPRVMLLDFEAIYERMHDFRRMSQFLVQDRRDVRTESINFN